MTFKSRLVLSSIALIVGTVAAGSAMAQDSKAAGSGPSPYVDCGIGAAIFKDTQWAAISSNVIWDLGTTAMISATMSPSTCNAKQVKVAVFIRDTQAQLVEELATGSGQHLTAVLNLSECRAAQHPKAIEALRTSLSARVQSSDFATQSNIEKSTQVYQAVDAAVSSSCAV